MSFRNRQLVVSARPPSFAFIRLYSFQNILALRRYLSGAFPFSSNGSDMRRAREPLSCKILVAFCGLVHPVPNDVRNTRFTGPLLVSLFLIKSAFFSFIHINSTILVASQQNRVPT